MAGKLAKVSDIVLHLAECPSNVFGLFCVYGKFKKSMILNFGKHSGKHISQVPTEYLDWLLKSNQETVRAVEEELARRALAEEANLSWVEKVIVAGYREMAKRHHPDVGGSTSDMQEINAAVEKLREIARGEPNKPTNRR